MFQHYISPFNSGDTIHNSAASQDKINNNYVWWPQN